MSGSRTALRGPQDTPQNRELVFCHQCQNEWYRDQYGLICPRCQSDFTEILESDRSDPREEVTQYGYDTDEDDDDETDFHHHLSQHHHSHNQHLHQHHTPSASSPSPHGFTLQMGGNTGPSIRFRTIRNEPGAGGAPFGSPFGRTTSGLNPHERSPFGGSPFEHTPLARSYEGSPMPDTQRRPSGASPNWGNNGGPVADMFLSIIQNIMGQGANDGQQRSPFAQTPGQFPGPNSPPPNPFASPFGQSNTPSAQGQNSPGEGAGRGSAAPPPGLQPFFAAAFPRGGASGARTGGTTYYSSVRTWTGPNGETRTIRTSSPMMGGDAGGGPGGGPGMHGGAAHGGGGTGGFQDNQPSGIELADFLSNLMGGGGGGGGGVNDPTGGLSPLFRAFGIPHGPTGDYAWSQADMDRILSQLMEQHQGNAPPPASEDVIRNLPKQRVTQEEVDEGNECVVCQDEFKFDEEVVKLPCKHVYHEECVRKWLELHDACPICRTPITPEGERQRRGNPGNSPGGGPGGPQQQAGGSGGGGGGGAGTPGSMPGAFPTSGTGGNGRTTWSWSFGGGGNRT